MTCSSRGAEPEANKAAFAGACGEPISSHRCELGEGLFISGALLAWLDIAADRLYLSEGSRVQAIDLPVKATVILDCVDDVLVVASAEGPGDVQLPRYPMSGATFSIPCSMLR